MNDDALKDYIKLPLPTDDLEFFETIKVLSNAYWAESDINKSIYGFQIQANSIWKDGLTEYELQRFENELGYKFPTALRNFYKTMNGLDKKGINVFGNRGHRVVYAPVYYSFPDDLPVIREKIEWVYSATNTSAEELLQKGISRIFPVCGHRFVLVDDPGHKVLSMHGNDIIPWADNISKLIATDIFSNIYNVWDFESNPKGFNVPFWLD